MNDLHTAALARELAARTDAPALLNADADRNLVDLNRIGETHERAPWFLEQLLAMLEAILARHERTTLLTVHGWNVIQPVVDLGLGYAPGADPSTGAVSAAFTETTVRRLVAECAARSIHATLGARYPARNRENLLQLFTTRHRDDRRALVRALVALAPRVDAVQLELGIVLRWPGPWRDRLIDACIAALGTPAGVAREPGPVPFPAPRPRPATPAAATPRRLEFAATALSGLAAIDAGRGGRLLLFPPEGGVVLFTGERTGPAPAGTVGALSLTASDDGECHVTFRGPLLRFPDTTPFLDLERGLAAADLVEAEAALAFEPLHGTRRGAARGAEFGLVHGEVRLGDTRHAIAGHGFVEEGTAPAPWPRIRTALHLGDGSALALTLGLAGGGASGFLCRGGDHVPVVGATAALGPDGAPLDPLCLDVQLGTGERLRVSARAVHRLPVIRGRPPGPVRLEYVACRLEGQAAPAGWCELGGVREDPGTGGER